MKYAIVTGSASGIGEAIAKQLIEKQISVIGLDINESDYTNYICDVSNEKNVKSVIEEISKKTNCIDYLFNCAGILTIGKPTYIKETPLTLLKAIMKVNFESVFIMSQATLPLLKKSHSASIINISSEQSYLPQLGYMPYAISKSSINTFTKCLAQELLFDKILVNSFALGTVKTKILQTFASLDEEELMYNEKEEKMPLGMIDSSEIAKFIINFVETNKYATGEIIKIDSGSSLFY